MTWCVFCSRTVVYSTLRMALRIYLPPSVRSKMEWGILCIIVLKMVLNPEDSQEPPQYRTGTVQEVSYIYGTLNVTVVRSLLVQCVLYVVS